VLRGLELARRHRNQQNRHRRDVQEASVVKTFPVNSLIDNERRPEKPSNPRRRVKVKQLLRLRSALLHQGCSTLSTEAPLEELFETGESGSVAILAEG